MFNFEKLNVYQKSVSFSNEVYQLTENWPKEHLFGIIDQLRRAALSISLNIAEGYSRSKNEFKSFLDIARGSAFECIPIIEIAYRRKLININQKEELYNQVSVIAKMISSLKSSTNNQIY